MLRRFAFLLCLTTTAVLMALEEVPIKEYTAGERHLQNGTKERHCKVFRLWPGDGTRDDDPMKGKVAEDNKRGVRFVTSPSMTVVKAKNADGRAVVLFPGGGYNFIAMGEETVPVARWLNRQGITVFIVKYRCPPRVDEGHLKHLSALQDAQRAIRIVRKNAKAFGIKKDKIGVMGFSAGAHLSAMLCHNYAIDSYKPKEPVDKISCRPDFAILVYPAIVFWGKELDPRFRNIKKIDMPVYMTIAADDQPCAKGTIAYAKRLKELKVAVDFNLYPKGGHGGGLNNYEWSKTCEKWLKTIAIDPVK